MRFAKVTDTQNRNLVTAEDNDDGNGFVVTTTRPGFGQVKTKFDRYGGMWNGEAWVPEVGQKLVERESKAVNGEFKTIDNKVRWVVTTGSRETTGRIEVYEGYGQNGVGANTVSIEEYRSGKLSLRETHTSNGVVKENYQHGVGGRPMGRGYPGGERQLHQKCLDE